MLILHLSVICISRPFLVLTIESVEVLRFQVLFLMECFGIIFCFLCCEVMWSLKRTCLWVAVSASFISIQFRLWENPSGNSTVRDLGSAYYLIPLLVTIFNSEGLISLQFVLWPAEVDHVPFWRDIFFVHLIMMENCGVGIFTGLMARKRLSTLQSRWFGESRETTQMIVIFV